MALIGLALLVGAATTALPATGEPHIGFALGYLAYGLFYMCTYPAIGRYYQLISLWSAIPGVSCAGWVMLTIILIALSVVVIPLSLVWHIIGAIIRLFK